MKPLYFTREQWKERYSKSAYESVFGETADLSESLFDYAFVVVDEHECPIIYTTIKQLSEKSLYIEHGGSFPDYRGSRKVLPAFKMLIDAWYNGGADRISLSTLATNVAMQKLALSAGFLPCGMFHNDKGLFLQYYQVKESQDGSN